jgi:hypothetical protein
MTKPQAKASIGALGSMWIAAIELGIVFAGSILLRITPYLPPMLFLRLLWRYLPSPA